MVKKSDSYMSFPLEGPAWDLMKEAGHTPWDTNSDHPTNQALNRIYLILKGHFEQEAK